MNINGFKCEDQDKLDRVIHGTMSREGKLLGGIGEGDEAAVLAAYDRLGGYITHNGIKVKTGSFYDFENRKAHKEPQVKYVVSVGGELIELNDPAELAQVLLGKAREENNLPPAPATKAVKRVVKRK